MAQILIHSTSSQAALQDQALQLQKELQLLGHHVEYSAQTHPVKILKNNYDVLHVLSEKHGLKWSDQSLLLTAKLQRVPTVVSSFECAPYQKNFLNQFQFKLIDAFSTTDLASLRSHKHLIKDKFILPFFPRIKLLKSLKEGDPVLLKMVSTDYTDLLQGIAMDDFPLHVDASALAQKWGLTTARKKWRQFQNRHPQFKSAILILQFENILELFKTQPLIIDLSPLTDVIKFHAYLEWALSYQQFIVLNKNQATGFPHFWKHQKNAWVTDLQEIPHTLSRTAKKFFKTAPMLSLSLEEKINELSRLYAKLAQEKILSYQAHKVSTT